MSIYSQDIWPERKFIIYKTTNLVNGMWYIGMRKLRSKNDGYLGSGKRFKYAKKKYGKHNFKREILYAFDNKQNMIDKEIELITKVVVNDEMCYNIRLGGEGGNEKLTENHKQNIKESLTGRILTEEHKRNIGKSIKGQKRTQKTKQTMIENHADFSGESNPNSKFTEEQVVQIIQDPKLWQWGGVAKIAREFGVNHSRIQNIKMGYSWKHLSKLNRQGEKTCGIA